MKTLFWNVDTQKDFMYEGWALPIPKAEKIIPNLARLTRYAREKGYPVVNTADWHNFDSKELSENPDFVNTFPPHCIKDTEGAEFIPETNPKKPYVVDWMKGDFNPERIRQHRNVVIYKDAFDVFAGNQFTDEVLETISPDRVVVYGVATNVCVDQAVSGLIARKNKVYAVKDAMQGLPGIELPYEKWKNLGVKFAATKNVLEGMI